MSNSGGFFRSRQDEYSREELGEAVKALPKGKYLFDVGGDGSARITRADKWVQKRDVEQLLEQQKVEAG